MPDTIEIIFKGERKELYANPQQFPFKVGDYAIVEADKGETAHYCVDCCLKKGCAHHKMEKGEEILTFFPE